MLNWGFWKILCLFEEKNGIANVRSKWVQFFHLKLWIIKCFYYLIFRFSHFFVQLFKLWNKKLIFFFVLSKIQLSLFLLTIKKIYFSDKTGNKQSFSRTVVNRALLSKLEESLGSIHSESEFNEFKPRLKSSQNRFQLSADLNIWVAYQI